MSTAPKPDPPRCDTPGCGRLASICTDGTEKDVALRRTAEGVDEPLNRKALPNLNVCVPHENWPFSEDAKAWAARPDSPYKARK